MALNLASEISVSEAAPTTRLIQGVSTAVAGFVGVTERGPFGATLVTSWADYLAKFGGDSANSWLPTAVRGFFDEGGTQAYIARTVHYTNIDSAATKQSAAGTLTLQSAVGAPGAGSVTGTIAGPWELTPADTLIINVDAGGDVTATFDAAAAIKTGTNTEPFALSDGQTITVSVDGGTAQTITFNTAEFVAIGAATAAEVAAVINGEISGASGGVAAGAVTITSDTKGTGSGITVTGGTAAGTLGLNATPVSGTGDVADISAVTAAEAKTLIEADISGLTVSESAGGHIIITSNTVGASSSIAVNATSTADTKFGVDNATHSGDSGAAVDAIVIDGKTDGAYTDDVTVNVKAASNGEALFFNLEVLVDGVIVEKHPNITMTATDDRFAETIVNGTNGSDLISVDEPTTPLGKRPANVAPSSALSGGSDGLTSLGDNDFLGSSTAKTGMRALDLVEDVRILCVPGKTTSAIQRGMLTYAETTRDMSMFAVLDPPSATVTSGMVTHVETTNLLLNTSEFGAIYFPRININNPNIAVFGSAEQVTVPPSGHIAGLYARNDGGRPGGVYDPPGGIEKGVLREAVALENTETKDKANREVLYPKRINPISLLGSSIILDGVRTLRGNSNFPTIAERRGVIFIEQSLKGGLEFARFRNNDAELRAEVRRAIILFLIQQMRRKAFRTQKPSTAFTVDVSDDLNPESVIFAGQLFAKVGLATQKPAEFINLIFSQDTRALDNEIASAGA
jgi:phage tail sheath protein FI